jgi:DNA-binding transcriptional ArsR family regulator
MMSDERPPVELTDPRALRAYAHPVRNKLVGMLRRRGPLTATQAGQLLGESSGTTSFHLRQLAKYGLVEPAPGGKGREKPWQATSLLTTVPAIAPSPEAFEAAKDLKAALAGDYFRKLTGYLRRSGQESEQWQRAAIFGDLILFVTPEELTMLSDALDELLRPYARRLGNVEERPSGARDVTFISLAFPTEPA